MKKYKFDSFTNIQKENIFLIFDSILVVSEKYSIFKLFQNTELKSFAANTRRFVLL